VKYLLDANACIGLVNGTSPKLARALARRPLEEVAVCSIVKAELYFGAAKSRHPDRSRREQDAFFGRFLLSYAFDDTAADAYASVRATLERAGTPIGPNDLLIAAIALVNDATLVTHNVREFSRVPGLRHEDWEG
jgi:tRNA(fMet)-specific endonuclease VapC